MELNCLRLFLMAAATSMALAGLPAAEALPAPPPDGAALFKKHCAACHGADGKAGTPMAKRLGVKDLTATALSVEQITGVINDGVKTNRGGMPAFKDKLAEEERATVAAFVRSLQPPPPAR